MYTPNPSVEGVSWLGAIVEDAKQGGNVMDSREVTQVPTGTKVNPICGRCKLGRSKTGYHPTIDLPVDEECKKCPWLPELMATGRCECVEMIDPT